MKVFQIGFNKCGTRSLKTYFRQQGLRTVHHDHGRLARTLNGNREEGRYILSGYGDYDAFLDMVCLTESTHIEAFKYYRDFLDEVPDPRFILNTRDKDKWVQSCRDHPGFVARMQAIYGYADPEQVIAHWLADWDRHYAAVREAIPPERLLVYDIEVDEPAKLNRFLGLGDSGGGNGDFTYVGWTPGKTFEAVNRRTPAMVKDCLPDGVKKQVSWLMRKRR